MWAGCGGSVGDGLLSIVSLTYYGDFHTPEECEFDNTRKFVEGLAGVLAGLKDAIGTSIVSGDSSTAVVAVVTLLGADKSVCKKESILYCVGKAAPLAIATILAGYGAGKLVSAFKANVGVVEALTEAGIGSTAEGILADSVFQKIGKTIQYAKSGGLESATADFERLTQGIEVTIREEGVRTATLSNGSKITVRPTSSGGFPTLDINTPGNPVIKVRY